MTQRQERLKFLRVTHTVCISGSESTQHLEPGKILVPFRFNIPSSIYGVNKNAYIGDREESLPPSLSLVSDTVHSEENFFIRGECNISYCVRGRLTTNTGKPCGETFRRVHFIPTRDQPLPPLCTTDFATEYVLGSSQRIGLFHVLQSKSSCELSIHTEEPCPLRFPCEKTASTTIYLHLRYLYPSPLGTYSPDNCPCPQPDVSLVVRTTLEAVTFFSTVPRNRLPKWTDVEPGQEVVKKTTLGPTQTRKLGVLTWVPLIQVYNNAECYIVNEQYKYGNLVGWQSNVPLVFTYEGDERPIPTFACTYASRRHVLSMRVRLKHHSATYRLCIPVQVIYSSNGLGATCESLAEESTACRLPMYTE
ncbi:hypothetical protein BDV40DRAFT_65359 [Aspergillus tamarii]|uniref:Arrestin-like N-terminal domain-containing protein n=1 Tax=Aspergillus tamarii TaxID=41984 RepID=A0A5N6UEB0_ASPTM|nr:hypothetical protein BDV40DRAFT_65359 [Aspergillus tamarii]